TPDDGDFPTYNVCRRPSTKVLLERESSSISFYALLCKLRNNWYPASMSKPTNPIPPGFNTITAHLNVNGAARYVEFLKGAFNAVEINRSPGPGGKLMHVLMRIGDSMIMFADDFSEEFHMPPFVEGNFPFVLNLYVPDADATWAQALTAGCEVKVPI